MDNGYDGALMAMGGIVVFSLLSFQLLFLRVVSFF